jgi:hypothetical protein
MTARHDHDHRKHLFARIRDVLLNDWDPMGLHDAAAPTDSYDDLAREVHAILTGPEASVERVAAYLRWAEREQLRLQRRPGEATEAAQKLMALLDETGAPDGH